MPPKKNLSPPLAGSRLLKFKKCGGEIVIAAAKAVSTKSKIPPLTAGFCFKFKFLTKQCCYNSAYDSPNREHHREPHKAVNYVLSAFFKFFFVFPGNNIPDNPP